MLVPTRAEFHALAKTGKLVPVYREVFADHDTPVSAFRKIDDGPYGFLLESVEGGEKWGREVRSRNPPSRQACRRRSKDRALRRFWRRRQ